MTSFVPASRIGESLPAAVALPTWSTVAGEERLYNVPSLFSWLQAGAPDANGKYADRSARGNNWLQSTAGSQPPLLTNWYGTGLSAFNFDGSTAYNIPGSFIFPPGEVTVAAVFDLNAGATAGEGKRRSLLVSQLNTSAGQAQYGFFQLARKPTLYNSVASYTVAGSAIATPAAPHLLLFSWSATDALMAVSIDGGAWTTFTIPPSGLNNRGTPFDTTCMLGAANTTFYMPWWGAIAEVLVFNTSLQNAAEAATASLVVSTLKAKYGIA